MKKFILLNIVILVAYSCGKKTTNKSSRYVKKSIGTPIPLKFSKQSCLGSLDISDSIAKTDLYLQGDYSSNVSIPINDKLMINSIKMGNEIFSFRDDLEIKNSGKNYSYCPDIDFYQKDTYEDATRSVETALSKFKTKFADNLMELNLPDIKLWVAPMIEIKSIYREKNTKYDIRQFLINNAFYSYELGAMAFLPQGYQEDGDELPFDGVPLWKIPMVALHEYGHHIFEILIKDKWDYVFSKKTGVNPCIDPRGFVEKANKAVFDERVINFELVRGALHEGFADLVSSLLGTDYASLENIGCMEGNREVHVARFTNWSDKTLDQDALDEFLSDTEAFYFGCGLDVDYQDIHIIGAIFARHVHVLFEELALTPEQRFELLVDWAKNLNKLKINTQSGNEKYNLKLTIMSMLTVAQKKFSLTDKVCKQYIRGFTALESAENSHYYCQ